MNKAALAKYFHISTKTVDAWVLKGCPHTRTKRGGYQFDPKAVAAWRAATMPIAKNEAGSITLNEARIRKEVALAGLRELQLKERSGELVLRSVVDQKWFALAHAARDRMQNIPARVSGPCASLRDQEAVFQLLTKEIDEALEDFSHGYDKETGTR